MQSGREIVSRGIYFLRRGIGWAAGSAIVMVIIGIIIGAQVAPVATQFVTKQTGATVAVITLQGGINGQNAASVVARLKRARENPRIKAVVLRVNSGGGSASASESIYMEVRRTAKQMPLVVSVNAIAASGAYYSSAPADEIFVKPASFIGSVGVFFVPPAQLNPISQIITTGPNKLTGNDRRGWTYSIEEARRSFVSAIMQHRSEELTISTRRVSYARIYSGGRGVRYGLADRVGTLQDAIKRAAAMADLQQYRVKIIGYDTTVSFVTQTAYLASGVENKTLVSAAKYLRRPSEVGLPNLLMLPPPVIREGLHDELAGRLNTSGRTRDITATTTGVRANVTTGPR